MRPSILLLTIIMAISTVMVKYDKQVYDAAVTRPQSTVVTQVAASLLAPVFPVTSPDMNFDELSMRMAQATQDASNTGAVLSIALLDRVTQRLITNHNLSPIATASVVKLFIADDLLMRTDQSTLSEQDRMLLETMLRSSDDGAAEKLWDRDGGTAIVDRVVHRYGLMSTKPPTNGAWWNTLTTTTDLVRYYDMLLTGAGGLPSDRVDIIISHLAHFTPYGLDGYPQRFGIPDGLYKEVVAVKQGWMCCVANNWMHLSTGIIGSDHRYVLAISSLQPTDDYDARTTITQAIKTLFPSGAI